MKRKKKRTPQPWKRALKTLKTLPLGRVAVSFVGTVFVLLVASSAKPQTLSEKSLDVSRFDAKPLVTAVTTNKTDSSWQYYHPVWQHQTMDNIKSTGFSSSQVQDVVVSEEKLVHFLHDPYNRVEQEFQVPAVLNDRVAFWMRIYTKLSEHARVVHDKDNPAIIYGTIDFSSLYAEGKPVAQARLEERKYEKKILAELKSRIQEAAGITDTGNLSANEKAEIRALLSRAGALDAPRAALLITRIRTQTGQRDEFLRALKRSEKLLPYIETVMKSFSLPKALARLPFVESSFNEKASSKVGAVGIWQFMPATAEQMIHSSDKGKWADPIAQTRAAARVFQIFRSLLPDWSTTITAYNSGVGRLQTLAKTYKAKSISKILDSDDKTLGFAGRNFYAQFLAANIIEAYKADLFLELSENSMAFSPNRAFENRFKEMF